MPPTKRKRRAQNLGEYSKKCARLGEPVGEQGDFLSEEFTHNEGPVDKESDLGSVFSMSLSEESEDDEPRVEDSAAAVGLFERLKEGWHKLQEAVRMRRRQKYNKFNSEKRTTLISRKQKVEKETKYLRQQGYQDIRSLFARSQVPRVPICLDCDAPNSPVQDPMIAAKPSPADPDVIDMVSEDSDGCREDGFEDDHDGNRLNEGSSEMMVGGRQLDWETGFDELAADAAHDEWNEGVVNKEVQIHAPQSQAPVLVNPSVPVPRNASLSTANSVPSPTQNKKPPNHDAPEVLVAIETLRARLKEKTKFHPILWARMTAMLSMLHFYTSFDKSSTMISWTKASELAAQGAGKREWYARQLRSWSRAFIEFGQLPTLNKSNTKRSLIEDELLASHLKMYLQSLGKYFKAADIVFFMDLPETRERFGLSKGISLRTAHRWLHAMGYRFQVEKKGMYKDGHEREDVVDYRQNIFLPKWRELERRMILRDRDGIIEQYPVLNPGESQLILLTHDESTFYAGDQRKLRWVHSSESPKPIPKGEGTSLMVSHFCSPEFGWLDLEDGSDSACLFFKAGKNREGYFTCDDLIKQLEHAIDIFEERCPYHQALFGFDNAPSHQKRPLDGLSAKKTPLRPKIWEPSPGIRMRNGKFADGTPQDLYFPPNHQLAGQFKGMKQILIERGQWPGKSPLTRKEPPAQCPGFHCPEGATRCCARRILFLQPDFIGQKSKLEEYVESRGHLVIFYPKYHCELNFIEMVWGVAKYEYRMFARPENIVEMEQIVWDCLNMVTLERMRRFSIRSARFMDSYQQELSGAEAAWINTRFHGHRTLPPEMIRLVKEMYSHGSD